MEQLYGRDYADMLTVLGGQDLLLTFEDLGAGSRDTWLELDLAGRDPDDGMTDVAYEKGYLFLRVLEQAVGREAWDGFLRDYFDEFAFRPMTTPRFLDRVREELFAGDPAALDRLGVEAWVYGPGLPANTPPIASAAFDTVDRQLEVWRAGTSAAELATGDWTTHEWLHFLRGLPDPLDSGRMAELDAAFAFTDSGNSEILCEWLRHAVAAGYRPAYPALERFLTGVGRRKFLRPLYRELAETPEGLEYARRIYATARPRYHAVSVDTVDEILEWSP